MHCMQALRGSTSFAQCFLWNRHTFHLWDQFSSEGSRHSLQVTDGSCLCFMNQRLGICTFESQSQQEEYIQGLLYFLPSSWLLLRPISAVRLSKLDTKYFKARHGCWLGAASWNWHSSQCCWGVEGQRQLPDAFAMIWRLWLNLWRVSQR